MKRRGILVSSGAALVVLAGRSGRAQAQIAGNTLLLNAGGEPDSIDPAKASFIGEIDKAMRVFRNLLKWDTTNALVPDQAESLPTVEDGGTRLTFRLRPGLSYSDGRPLAARDFEFGWKRHLDPRTESGYAFAGFAIQGAEAYHTADLTRTSTDELQRLRDAVGVTALDDRTLEFKLISPAPWFLAVLATWCGVPVREDLISAARERWTEPATYIGNGPYVLAEWDHANRMRFEANPYFWPAPPLIRSVEYAMIAEPAVAFAAYLNDELDVAGLQREDRPRVDSDPRLRAQLHEYSGNCTIYVGFNTKLAPFNLTHVRQAFSSSFDRESYVRHVMGGQGLPAGQFVPPGMPGNYYDLAAQGFDLARARRLLAAAGYPGGQGLPRVKWSYSANARMRVRLEALASQLTQSLGVRVELDPVESRSFSAALKRPETTPQMFLVGWCQDYPDPQNWYSAVFSSRSAIGHTGWGKVEFDQLTREADEEPDPRRRDELYRQAAQLLLEDAPAAFLFHSQVWLLVKPRVQGFREDPLEYFLGEHDLSNLRLVG